MNPNATLENIQSAMNTELVLVSYAGARGRKGITYNPSKKLYTVYYGKQKLTLKKDTEALRYYNAAEPA